MIFLYIILAIVAPILIVAGRDMMLSFVLRNHLATNQAYTTTTTALDVDNTKVATTFIGRNRFPMNVMIPMMKSMLLRDMNKNMINLKRILEERQA